MKLIDLEPRFIRYETKQELRDFIVGDHETWQERGQPVEKRLTDCEYHIYVDKLAEAQGIMFLCPKCFEQNKGIVGTHSIQVTFDGRNVLSHEGVQNKEGPVRWQVSGNDYNDLTIQPSILLLSGCGWHGYVTNGGTS